MINKIIDYLSIITMEDEMWTPIIDGEYSNYFISNHGRVINSKTRKILKQHLNFRGHPSIFLCQNGKTKRVLIHTLVARAFVNNDDPENKKIVQHIDFNRLNNHYTNLSYGSVRKIKNKNGEIVIFNKYTEEQIHQVCKLMELEWKPPEIAKTVKVNRDVCSTIKSKRGWKDISKNYNISGTKV